MDELPERTKITKEQDKNGRTVLRVELPPGSPQLNRKGKARIKAIVRKHVKLEKKKLREAIAHDTRLIKESFTRGGDIHSDFLPDVAIGEVGEGNAGLLHRGEGEPVHAPVVLNSLERSLQETGMDGTEFPPKNDTEAAEPLPAQISER